MDDSIFLDIDDYEKVPHSFYASVGRALWIAQNFESSCRSLMFLIDIKKEFNGQNIDELRKDALKRLLGKNINNFKTLLKGHIPEDVFEYLFDILDKAREARNFIAHEITHKCGELAVEPEKLKKELINEIHKNVSIISEADKNICGILSTMTNQPIPAGECLDKYSQNIADWVCEPLKND